MNYTSMCGWHRVVGVVACTIETGEFEKLTEPNLLPGERKKWKPAQAAFSEADLAYAIDKVVYAIDEVEKQLGRTTWLGGGEYTLAGIDFYSMCGMTMARTFPELTLASRYRRTVVWRERMTAPPAITRSLAVGGGNAPGLPTFTGHAR